MRADRDLIIEPGSLRDQVLYQRPVASKSASGADVVTWVDYLQVRANVGSPKAKSFFAAGREVVEKAYPVEQWYQAAFDAGQGETMRAIWNGRELEVLTVVDVQGQHRVMYLQLREIL